MLLPLAGRRLYYDITGPENAPVVCITHSLASDGGSWAEQVPPLLEAGFRVLRLAMRGHGGSEPVAGDYTMQALAGDVAAALDALAMPRVHYIGLSIGGMIGQAFAIEHGAKLISAMWCDTLPASPSGAAATWDERMNTALGELVGAAWRHYDGALVHRRIPSKQARTLEADPRHHRRDDTGRLFGLFGGDHELRIHRETASVGHSGLSGVWLRGCRYPGERKPPARRARAGRPLRGDPRHAALPERRSAGHLQPGNDGLARNSTPGALKPEPADCENPLGSICH